MLKKCNLLLSLVLLMSLCLTVAAYAGQGSINNKDYPEIVLKVGDKTVTNNEFAEQVKKVKTAYEINNTLQDKSYYEKEVLKKIIMNELIDQVVTERGIAVTDEESKKYLKESIALFNDVYKEDPNKVFFIESVKELGFSSLEEYAQNKKVLDTAKIFLARGKLAAEIAATVKEPAEEEVDEFIQEKSKVEKDIIEIKNDPAAREQIRKYLLQKKQLKAYREFKQELFSKGNYEIYISVDL